VADAGSGEQPLAPPTSPPPPPAPPFCQEGYPPERCSSIWGICGNPASNRKLAIDDKSQICIGFDSSPDGGATQKAVFQVKVDAYSRLRVSALWPTFATANWSDVAQYSYMWLGAEGHRTIGQTRGIVTAVGADGSFNCTHAAGGSDAAAASDCDSAAVGCACYGWANQSKPTLTAAHGGAKLIAGLTAIIHVAEGAVTHVMWDSGCNLCQGRNDGSMTCHPDQSRAVCKSQDGWTQSGEAGECADCYLAIDPATCRDEACAPTIYVAWEGTDKHGMPLLSAGGILSRFQQYSLNGVYDELRDEIMEVPDSRI